VDLVEVDVVGPESAQAVVDLGHDGLARQAGSVRPRSHPVVDLGRQHEIGAVGVLRQGAAEDLLAGTSRVDVGGVEEVDARFQRAADERAGGGLVEIPVVVARPGKAEAHRAKADPRDIESC
jgi:hypothetical protein